MQKTTIINPNRVLPQTFQGLAGSRFPIKVQVPHYLPTKNNWINYPSVQVIGPDRNKIEIDCDANYFSGIQAGDLITSTREDSPWYRKIILAIGYTANLDGPSPVLWGKPFDMDSGNLTNAMEDCPSHYKESLRVLKERGTYDIISNTEIVPATDRHSDYFAFLNLRPLFDELLETQKKNKDTYIEPPLSFKTVMERLELVLIKGESLDFFRRLHNLFSFKDLALFEKKIEECRSYPEIQKINSEFFNAPQNYLIEKYTDEEVEKMRVSIIKNRQKLDSNNIFSTIISRLKEIIVHKIGLELNFIHCVFTAPEEEAINQFLIILNKVLQETLNYLTPLFDVTRVAEAFEIYHQRPVYFKYLLERYSDPLNAAKHVVAIALNSISGYFERSFSCDFRHVVTQGKIGFVDRQKKQPSYVPAIDQNTIKKNASIEDMLGLPLLNSLPLYLAFPRSKEPPSHVQLMHHDFDIYPDAYPAAPPSESHKNILRLVSSTGCEESCSYCTLYKGEKKSLMNFLRFQQQFSLTREFIGLDALKSDFNRIFLTGADGLNRSTQSLVEILEYVHKNTDTNIRKIGSYATTGSILKHEEKGLRQLNNLGLTRVYWGIESGNNEVLDFVGKRHHQKGILEAGRLLNRVGILISATVMPGLGGIKYKDRHAMDTAEVIGQIGPRYLTFMGGYAPGTPYAKQLLKAKDNRELTSEEMIDHIKQMRDLCIEALKKYHTITGITSVGRLDVVTDIAAYTPDITPAALNPFPFRIRIG